MKKLLAVIVPAAVILSWAMTSPLARACGDKLTILGGGIPFDRIHSDHRHGSVLLYLNPDSRLSTASGDSHLDETLTRNGHQVRIARTDAELKQALSEGKVDFVLADWSEAPRIQPDVSGGIPIVSVIPGGSQDARAHVRAGCMVESYKGHDRQFVRDVEALLDNQVGLSASCGGAAARASG
jgi:hypothetical protein